MKNKIIYLSSNVFGKLSDKTIKVSKAIDPVQYLEKFKDDPNIYLSYIGAIEDESGRHPKLGINPRSHYNTPLGIYTYPLREIWEGIRINGLDSVPYQGNKPYVAVIKTKKDANFINDMYADYSSYDYDIDVNKLRNYFVPDILTLDEFQDVVEVGLFAAKEKNPVMSMWNIVRTLSFIVASIKRGSEKKYVLEEIKSNTLENIMPDKEKGRLNPYSLSFNNVLFKVLGYDGFGDKSGKGYIHPSENVQSVFLNPRSYETITILENKEAGNIQHQLLSSSSSKIMDLADKISEKNWDTILVKRPYLWFYCPYDELKQKHSAHVDKYFATEMGKTSSFNLLVDHSNDTLVLRKFNELSKKDFALLPLTYEELKDRYISHLSYSPMEYDIVIDALKDQELLEISIDFLKEKIINNVYYLAMITRYETNRVFKKDLTEIIGDEKVKNAIKNFISDELMLNKDSNWPKIKEISHCFDESLWAYLSVKIKGLISRNAFRLIYIVDFLEKINKSNLVNNLPEDFSISVQKYLENLSGYESLSMAYKISSLINIDFERLRMKFREKTIDRMGEVPIHYINSKLINNVFPIEFFQEDTELMYMFRKLWLDFIKENGAMKYQSIMPEYIRNMLESEIEEITKEEVRSDISKIMYHPYSKKLSTDDDFWMDFFLRDPDRLLEHDFKDLSSYIGDCNSGKAMESPDVGAVLQKVLMKNIGEHIEYYFRLPNFYYFRIDINEIRQTYRDVFISHIRKLTREISEDMFGNERLNPNRNFDLIKSINDDIITQAFIDELASSVNKKDLSTCSHELNELIVKSKNFNYEGNFEYWVGKALLHLSARINNPFGEKLYEVERVKDAVKTFLKPRLYEDPLYASSHAKIIEEIKNPIENFLEERANYIKARIDEFGSDEYIRLMVNSDSSDLNENQRKEIFEFAINLEYKLAQSSIVNFIFYVDYPFQEIMWELGGEVREFLRQSIVNKIKESLDDSKITKNLSPQIRLDESIQRELLINDYKDSLLKGEIQVKDLSPMLQNDPEMIEFINLHKVSINNHDRHVWSSYFNDNIIVGF